jgi:acyl dehydratase
MKQLYFDDVEVGSELKPLSKKPTACNLLMWAGASGDLNPIHWDTSYARKRGLPGIVVHGQLAGCYLGQLVTGWMGPLGIIKKLTISYRGLNLPGDELTCRGVVTKKQEADGQLLVTAKLSAENPRGEQTLGGTVTVALPSR